MPFDLKHVESFVAVAEAKSFSIAAERANTVQSAISAHLKELEHRLGRRLVDRGRGRPVALTTDGAAFLVQARRLLLLADDMVQGPRSPQQTLRIGTTVTFALSTVPMALALLPDPASVRTARSHEVMALLDRNLIDAAVVFDQGAHPLRCATVEMPLAWVGAKDFQGGDPGSLPMAFMEDARDLRRHAFTALDQVGGIEAHLTPHPDPVGLRAVVMAGRAVTVLPRPAITPPLDDIGARLFLPELPSLPVSVYARDQGVAMVLAQSLL